jgi:Peptidase family M28
MGTADTVAALVRFTGRGAGSDAERRAANRLVSELESGGRDALLEPFWCRPNWAIAHLWHVVLALAGSIVAVSSPTVGGVLVLLALLSLIADALTGRSLGRRLSPERASQNVISTAPPEEPRVRLLLTANYDTGRTGLAYRWRLRRALVRANARLGDAAPGWLGWLTIMLVWLLAVAVARVGGSKGTAISALQLIPTVALVLAGALLIELATSDWGPGANDNASGVAAALALARALDAGPPRNLAVELVLTGAGDGDAIGLRTHLRARRQSLKRANAVVLGLAACGGGEPRWWVSDGALAPGRYFAALRELCERIAREESYLNAAPHRDRGISPAQPARSAGLPAIAIGARDEDGLAPRSHGQDDTPEALDPAAIDAVVSYGLLLVDAIDGYIGRLRSPAQPAKSVLKQLTPE